MKGYMVEKQPINISGLEFKVSFYVAPIEDDMLIGLDFMSSHKATINMDQGYLNICNHEIPFVSIKGDSVPAVKKGDVRIATRTVVPAKSVLRVPCTANQPLKEGNYLIEPNVKTLLAPRVCIEGSKAPVMSFVNISDNKVTLFKNQKVGHLYEIDEIVPDSNTSSNDIVYVSKVTKQDELPEYLKDLYQRSCTGLSESEQSELKSLLINYSDVFSSHEYDIGSFTAIEHSIDTGDAKPIKQRFRRTPICFEGEAEKQIEKMIKADVIEPSVSEWAFSPVLVRKRDGSVRWCVDYRALNNVTKKDVFPLPLVEECMDTLSGNIWFSKLDATWGYWQIKVKEEDKCKTAFFDAVWRYWCLVFALEYVCGDSLHENFFV
ncbi:hypothetical protein FSP39_020247 [Pinctada imbricata]|uniref:Reverse transcriptase domain-containing protein n=1 Tax=Pinctada imbricata TaxID=66713 RepID=A0AA89C487_PINIB|nr:hypothetical protein FSP39_006751 [Pinctada imbricata]KAK3108982.1 hypothetical protein FSP39_020247 [Pinctada imbricata]